MTSPVDSAERTAHFTCPGCERVRPVAEAVGLLCVCSCGGCDQLDGVVFDVVACARCVLDVHPQLAPMLSPDILERMLLAGKRMQLQLACARPARVPEGVRTASSTTAG